MLNIRGLDASVGNSAVGRVTEAVSPSSDSSPSTSVRLEFELTGDVCILADKNNWFPKEAWA
jgi:hypothetical protein